jgi:hypothetical protein
MGGNMGQAKRLIVLMVLLLTGCVGGIDLATTIDQTNQVRRRSVIRGVPDPLPEPPKHPLKLEQLLLPSSGFDVWRITELNGYDDPNKLRWEVVVRPTGKQPDFNPRIDRNIITVPIWRVRPSGAACYMEVLKLPMTASGTVLPVSIEFYAPGDMIMLEHTVTYDAVIRAFDGSKLAFQSIIGPLLKQDGFFQSDINRCNVVQPIP